MTSRDGIFTNSDPIVAAVKAVESRLATGLHAGVRDSLVQFRRTHLRERFTGYANSSNRAVPGKVRTRSGFLRRSFSAANVSGSSLSTIKGRVTIGDSIARYARIQEFGGIIRPKSVV